jgi:phospholipid N-methyltransferase
MKVLQTAVFAFALALGLGASAMAEMGAAVGVITGQVISTDATKHELTIREEGTQQMRTFKVLNPDVLDTLKSGDKVQVNAADESTVTPSGSR